MAVEWPTAQLGDVTSLLTGFPFKSEAYTDDSCAPRLLRGDNVAQGVLRWDGAKRWSKKATHGLEPYWLMEDDVILAMDRPWIEAGLKYASVRKSDLPVLLVQRVARLRGTSALETSFLKYVIGGRAFTEYVLAVQTGTAVPHISAGQIRAFEFCLPPVAEQRRIASILGALDDKIELNRQMNRTLEEMPQAIFKSWFIDFDGQDDLVESELGLIPRGWEVGPLSVIAHLTTSTVNPGDQPNRQWEHYSIPAYDQGGCPAADRGASIKSNKYEVDETAVLVSKLNPTIRRVWLPDVQDGRHAVCSTEFMPFVPKEPTSRAFVYELLNSDPVQAGMCGRVTGTTGSRQRVRPADIANMSVVLSPVAVREEVSRIIGPLHARRQLNLRESATLAALRDALLPRLISGEIRVPVAEEILEAGL